MYIYTATSLNVKWQFDWTEAAVASLISVAFVGWLYYTGGPLSDWASETEESRRDRDRNQNRNQANKRQHRGCIIL